MKKSIFVILVLIVTTITTKAQIPNSGFETWITTGAYEDPKSWTSMNGLSLSTFFSCKKSTDHYPQGVGSYSVRLENNVLLGQTTGGWGLALSGPLSYPVKPTFPVIGHPNSLHGYYKYNSINKDSLWISVALFKKGVQVSTNNFKTKESTAAWTPFTINLPTYATADSAFIIMGAFYPTGISSTGPKGNSVLYIDNLSWDGFVNSIPQIKSKKAAFSIYPNPASNSVSLKVENTNNSELTINIYNLIGALVQSEKLKQKQQLIDIKGLKNGLYMFEIKSKDWSERQKLIVEK